jgi:hypothetical protein
VTKRIKRASVSKYGTLKKYLGIKGWIYVCLHFTVLSDKNIELYLYKPPNILILLTLNLACLYLGTGLKLSIML